MFPRVAQDIPPKYIGGIRETLEIATPFYETTSNYVRIFVTLYSFFFYMHVKRDPIVIQKIIRLIGPFCGSQRSFLHNSINEPGNGNRLRRFNSRDILIEADLRFSV